MRPTWLGLLIPLAGSAQWQQLPDFPGTARDDAASFTIDGIIYVGTGMEVGWGLTNDWYAFDTGSGTWSAIAPLPASPRQYCAGFTLLGKGYLFGGVDASGALNELWCYDPSLDEWQEKASLPGEGRYACVATGAGGSGQIVTGMLASGVPTNEHWSYTGSVDNWFWSPPIPGPARHRAAYFSNTALVVAGGADANGTALADVWQYDIIFPTGDWLAGPPLPEPRIGARGVSGWNMVIGGASDGTSFHADAWVLNNGSWTSLPAFAGGPRRGAASGGTAGGAYAGTGSDELQRHRDWWYLHPQTGMEELDAQPLRIVPNPAVDELRITFTASDQQPYHVLDALGRTVLTGAVTSGDAIDVSTLMAGRYTIHVHAEPTMRATFIKLP